MSIFGNKKEKSRESIAKMLLEASDRIMKNGAYNNSSVEFVKIAVQYSLMDMQRDIDLDKFLIEKIENLGNIMIKEEKDSKHRDSQLTIALYEKFPDFLKDIKSTLKKKEREYAGAKASRDNLMKVLDDMARKLERVDIKK